jgi:hypothetical protein
MKKIMFVLLLLFAISPVIVKAHADDIFIYPNNTKVELLSLSSFDEGYDAGFSDGYYNGYEDGKKEGYQTGYDTCVSDKKRQSEGTSFLVTVGLGIFAIIGFIIYKLS